MIFWPVFEFMPNGRSLSGKWKSIKYLRTCRGNRNIETILSFITTTFLYMFRQRKLMLPREEVDALTEEDFTIAMLSVASQEFNQNEKKYLRKARLVKLVAFGADRMRYPLTRGWRQYGHYAPVPHRYVTMLMRHYGKFEDFPTFKTKCSRETLDKFRGALLALKPNFLMNKEDFNEWVHQEKAPPLYRGYYKYAPLLDEMLSDIQKAVSDGKQFNCALRDLNNIVFSLEESLDHVEDSRILDFFFEYMNLWRILLLRIKNRGISPQAGTVMSDLVEIYRKFFLPALSPYERTLKGMNAKEEGEKFRKKIDLDLNIRRSDFENLRNEARSQSLTATLDEIRNELTEMTAGWSHRKIKEFNKVITATFRS